MTIKLFENNSLLKQCVAKVTACTPKDGKYLVELDQTVFFPEGGGQLSDRGKLADAVVSHVSEKDGHIYHECDKPLEVGAEAEAVLDWPVRLDRMQQHLGEHLLSYACWKLFKANNIGFHMNEDDVFIDLDKELTDEELLQAELTLRDENRRKRLIKRAGFPTYKTFEGYSYHCVKFPPAFSREELETLEFVPGKKNLVLYGPVGIGKTHMAIAAGVKACNLGYKTKFYTVTELVLKLAESRKNGTLERLLRDLRSLDLLILDEWGYVPVDKDGSQLLFRVISDSYESKSLILTTNLEFSKWGGIFTDDQMAAAMIDRLVHHGHLLIFEGKSYRMEHALMRRDA